MRKSKKNSLVSCPIFIMILGKLKKYEAQKNYLNREIGDFVAKNKYYQGFWQPDVQKEIINITKREEADKLDRAVKSKEEQEETERKRKYFFIHKWSLIKSRVSHDNFQLILFFRNKNSCSKRLRRGITGSGCVSI